MKQWWTHTLTGLLSLMLALAPALAADAQQTPTSPRRTPSLGRPGGRPALPSLGPVGVERPSRPTTTTRTGEAPERPSIGDEGSRTVAAPEPPAPPKPTVKTGGGQVRPPAAAAQQLGKPGTFQPFLKEAVPYEEVPRVGQPMIDLSTLGGITKVGEFLDVLYFATNWNILVTQAAEQTPIRFWVNNLRPYEAMEVLKFHGIYYDFDAEKKFLYVMTQEEYLQGKFGTLERVELDIRYADLTDMQTILSQLASPNGKMIVDARTSTLIIYDTAHNLNHILETAALLDVPLEQRVFYLQYVNAEQVLDAIVEGQVLTQRGIVQADSRVNSIIVTDMPSRLNRVAEMLQTLDQQMQTVTWTLNYIEPAIVEERLGDLVPEEMGFVSVDEETFQISVTAIPERLQEIDERIKMWDVQPKQVQIESYIVAVNSDKMRDLGISWTYFDEKDGVPFAIRSGTRTPNYGSMPEDGQNVAIGRLPYQIPMLNQFGVPVTGLPVDSNTAGTILDPEFQGNRVSAVLEFLEQEDSGKVLDNTLVTVMDGQEAAFRNTRDVPYVSASTYSYTTGTVVGDSGTTFASSRPYNTVKFVEVGTVLTVIPRITEVGDVVMEVVSEQSDATLITIEADGRENTAPQKTQSTAETKVLVQSGETLVIGGLKKASINDSIEKVPLLGDIPLLGRLFKTTSKDDTKNQLLVFITPTIVDGNTQPEAEVLAAVDEDIAKRIRHDKKGAFGQIYDKLSGGRNEINVAIGQGGHIFSEGRRRTMHELREDFAEVKSPTTTTVVIRAHPRASKSIALEVAEAALGANMKIDEEKIYMPIVPAEAPVLQEVPELEELDTEQ